LYGREIGLRQIQRRVEDRLLVSTGAKNAVGHQDVEVGT
jgi:hypothetical protein